MKEWCIKHPILTFLLADSAICGVVNIIKAITGAFTLGTPEQELQEVEGNNEEDKAE